MTRIVLWSLVAGLALITTATLWFLENFEQVPETHYSPPQKEARQNRYLALERLLEQLKRPVERLNSPRSLDRLPTNGILILDENRRRNIDQARAQRLLNWVHNGGYLIVAAESASDDPLLARLGISHYETSPEQCKPTGKTTDTGEEEEKDGDENNLWQQRNGKPTTVSVVMPANPTRYQLKMPGRGLVSTQPEPSWRAGPAEKRSNVLHFTWGRGQITVFDDLAFLNNYRIGDLDHAELIWALIDHYQPQGTVHLASRLEIQTLWQWLAESAWMALISAATLIALWLWRIVPRFGGTRPTPDDERRGLSQHLLAVGRSVWREGGVAHWLAVVRQSVNQKLSLRRPDLQNATSSEQRIALAKIAGCKTIDIASALSTEPTTDRSSRRTGQQTYSPDSFTQAMQTLQRLDQRL